MNSKGFDYRRNYKKQFVFNAKIKLKKFFLHLEKKNTFSFEIHSKNNFMKSNNIFVLEDHEYSKNLNDSIHLPIQVGYDIRKKRFFNFEI